MKSPLKYLKSREVWVVEQWASSEDLWEKHWESFDRGMRRTRPRLIAQIFRPTPMPPWTFAPLRWEREPQVKDYYVM